MDDTCLDGQRDVAERSDSAERLADASYVYKRCAQAIVRAGTV